MSRLLRHRCVPYTVDRNIVPVRRAGAVAVSADGFVGALGDIGLSLIDTVDLLYNCPSAASRGFIARGEVSVDTVGQWSYNVPAHPGAALFSPMHLRVHVFTRMSF